MLRTKVAKSLGTCEKSSACQRDFKKGEPPIYSSRCEAVRLGADPKDMIYRDLTLAPVTEDLTRSGLKPGEFANVLTNIASYRVNLRKS